jgi:hypothetical protein
MAIYLKKPTVVEARRLDYTIESLDELAKWCNGNVYEHQSGIGVPTLGGASLYAQVGDYIIKGIDGEFYPCKPDIFEATYEPG